MSIVDYTMNNLIYAENSNFTRIRHQLNAVGTGELIKDLFFVDGRASIMQQNLSLLGPQAINNVNVTGNRADVRTHEHQSLSSPPFWEFCHWRGTLSA